MLTLHSHEDGTDTIAKRVCGVQGSSSTIRVLEVYMLRAGYQVRYRAATPAVVDNVDAVDVTDSTLKDLIKFRGSTVRARFFSNVVV